MSAKTSNRELVWIAACVLGLFVYFFTVIYLRGGRYPSVEIASKAQRIELVNAMRLALAAASEAQNSAVMSTNEKDSRSFAQQARSSTEALERGRMELAKLLKERRDSKELELMERFARSLREFEGVDKQLADLALKNSNRKAYALAFGPAMKLLQQMDLPLSRIVADQTGAATKETMEVVRLADDVRIGILRMQTILLPHIAEESDEKMDEFEVLLDKQEQEVREKLDALKASPLMTDSSNIAMAISRFEEFETLKSQILKLSRENTDVRAVSIALKEKRKAMLACQDALGSLEQAIQGEPITMIPVGR